MADGRYRWEKRDGRAPNAVTFRLDLPGTLYLRCLIFDTRAAQRAWWKQHNGPKGAAAACSSVAEYVVRPDGSMRKRGIVAYVAFYKASLGAGIVAHELLHATFAWARRVKLDFGPVFQEDGAEIGIHHPEERMTTVHGQLNADFWATYLKMVPEAAHEA